MKIEEGIKQATDLVDRLRKTIMEKQPVALFQELEHAKPSLEILIFAIGVAYTTHSERQDVREVLSALMQVQLAKEQGESADKLSRASNWLSAASVVIGVVAAYLAYLALR
jgi:hypothetical protein